MTDKNPLNNPEWAALAQETLDLWQEHLQSYATDPQMKADLVKLVAPMGQMFAQWASVMQNGAHGSTPDTSGGQQAAQDSDGGASGDGDMSELADRVAELERQIDELEARLTAEPAPLAGAAGGGTRKA